MDDNFPMKKRLVYYKSAIVQKFRISFNYNKVVQMTRPMNAIAKRLIKLSEGGRRGEIENLASVKFELVSLRPNG